MNNRSRQVDKLTTAKFLAWNPEVNALVRVMLKRGESIEFEECHSHDEGWSSERATYYNTGEEVICQKESDGTDCDGRLSHYNEYSCPLKYLHASYNYCGDKVPAWQDVKSYQRDYSAERMGY